MDDARSVFSALYLRYAADVFGFALYLCGDRDEAEDITSETFVRLWTATGPLRSETVKSYLLTIARNLYLHERRRHARREPMPRETIDTQAGADVIAERRDQVTAVSAELGGLKEIDRSAILMHATQDMTYQQIAEALGISLASVKVRIHRARLRLAHIR